MQVLFPTISMLIYIFELLTCFVLCLGQNPQRNETAPTNLHNALSEGMGNFSVELLYHGTKTNGNQNLVIAPVTAWTVLAVTREGALGNTRKELSAALRITAEDVVNRQRFAETARWLTTSSKTVELAKFTGIFVDKKQLLERDFKNLTRNIYDTYTVELDFNEGKKTANFINQAISNFTRGRIPTLVEAGDFTDTAMIITSAVYFKGLWTAPFNISSTTKRPFLDSRGVKIGEVNMMYNRFTYPFANIKELKARVIELPYGKENRLSMLVMLPNPGVTLEDMFLSFATLPLDRVFSELRISQEEYGEDEVDCFIPRFKIESNLDLTDTFKTGMRINDLFNPQKANLGNMARVPMYASKVIHKAEIEVTEDGTVASAVTAAEFANRIGVVRFEANRPFSYLIIEKVTNAIVFGGVYQQPVLY